MMKPNRIALLLAPLALAGCAASTQTASAPPPPAQAYQAGMVSAADPRAAEAGAQMLRQGGSATDAAIATMLALTVVEPQSSGIGGGGLFVSTNSRGQVETIDGRETAPSAASPKWFVKDGVQQGYMDAVPGGTSVGVPGNVALAAKAHRAHGRLPWAGIFLVGEWHLVWAAGSGMETAWMGALVLLALAAGAVFWVVQLGQQPMLG